MGRKKRGPTVVGPQHPCVPYFCRAPWLPIRGGEVWTTTKHRTRHACPSTKVSSPACGDAAFSGTHEKLVAANKGFMTLGPGKKDLRLSECTFSSPIIRYHPLLVVAPGFAESRGQARFTRRRPRSRVRRGAGRDL